MTPSRTPIMDTIRADRARAEQNERAQHEHARHVLDEPMAQLDADPATSHALALAILDREQRQAPIDLDAYGWPLTNWHADR